MLHCRINRDDGFVEIFAYSVQRGDRFLVVFRGDGCACFLQTRARVVERGMCAVEFPRGDVRGFRGAETRVELLGAREESRDARFGIAAGLGLSIGSGACGRLRALAGIERVTQRLAVVALIDGFVRFLQRGSRGTVVVGRVLVGAGCARRVDRALRLIEFLLRRLGTCGQAHERDTESDQPTHAKSIATIDVA